MATPPVTQKPVSVSPSPARQAIPAASIIQMFSKRNVGQRYWAANVATEPCISALATTGPSPKSATVPAVQRTIASRMELMRGPESSSDRSPGAAKRATEAPPPCCPRLTSIRVTNDNHAQDSLTCSLRGLIRDLERVIGRDGNTFQIASDNLPAYEELSGHHGPCKSHYLAPNGMLGSPTGEPIFVLLCSLPSPEFERILIGWSDAGTMGITRLTVHSVPIDLKRSPGRQLPARPIFPQRPLTRLYPPGPAACLAAGGGPEPSRLHCLGQGCFPDDQSSRRGVHAIKVRTVVGTIFSLVP